mgnify:CR=1 FL=1
MPLTLGTTAGRSLRGTVRVPGDKSISHRALLFGAIAEGTTLIRIGTALFGARKREAAPAKASAPGWTRLLPRNQRSRFATTSASNSRSCAAFIARAQPNQNRCQPGGGLQRRARSARFTSFTCHFVTVTPLAARWLTGSGVRSNSSSRISAVISMLSTVVVRKPSRVMRATE